MPMATAYSGPDCDLQPNAQTMQAFLDWWFEFCTKGRVEIGWLDPKGYGLIHFLQFDLRSNELVPTAIGENLIPGQSIYIRASTVNFRAVFSKEEGYTTDDDFVQAPGIWGDLDTPEHMANASSIQTILRPNGRIITGRYPHLRAQNFFRAELPIVSAALVKSLNQGILKLYGGDTAVVNPTRLMRLPGTIAWPHKKDRIPELTSFTLPPDNRPSAYPIGTMRSQFPVETTPDRPVTQHPPGTRATLNLVSEYIRQIQAGDHWHDNMIRVVAHWIGRGWSNIEILTAAEAFTIPGYTNTQTITEVTKAITGGRTRWGVPDQEATISVEPATPFAADVIDPWDSLQAPAFPIEALPPVLRDFVEARARVIGADECAMAWTAISACSAALDGRLRVKMRRYDTWTVPAPIWVALVGQSSSKKTPIIREAWTPLEEVQARAMKEYAAQLHNYNQMTKAEKAETDEPPPPLRLVTHNATMEAIQGILSHQDRGLGILADELAGLIAGMDKYANKGGAERGFFLQLYNGGSYVADRIGRGTVVINNLLGTICGGIQPDRLAQFSDLTDDGLWQRFLPIIVGKGDIGGDEPPSEEVKRYRTRLADLLDSTSGNLVLSFSDAAHEVRETFEREAFALEQSAPLGPRFASFCGKLPGLFGRMCAVMNYLEPTGLGYLIGEKAAKAARFLLLHSAVPHAARVYTVMGDGAASAETMQAIAGYILVKNVTRLVISDLTTNVRCCRKCSVQDVVKMLSPLIAGGWLNPETDLPFNKAWLVNPLVVTRFGERASREIARREASRSLIGDHVDEIRSAKETNNAE